MTKPISMTTLEPQQAVDFFDNFLLAVKDGMGEDWLDTISMDYAEKVVATVRDLAVLHQYSQHTQSGIAAACECYMHSVSKVGPEDATICSPCAYGILHGITSAREYIIENATPQIQKVLDIAEAKVKKEMAAGTEALANQMSKDLGIPLEEARKELGLTNEAPPSDWSTPSLDQ